MVRTFKRRHWPARILLVLIGLVFLVDPVLAHNVTAGDKGYILEMTGMNLLPFAYLGAKHMVNVMVSP